MLGHGDAFYFNEPGRPADGSDDDEVVIEGRLNTEELFDKGIVGGVPQVNDGLLDVVEGGVGFLQKGLDV